jgi:hypothetical protein
MLAADAAARADHRTTAVLDDPPESARAPLQRHATPALTDISNAPSDGPAETDLHTSNPKGCEPKTSAYKRGSKRSAEQVVQARTYRRKAPAWMMEWLSERAGIPGAYLRSER